MSDAAFVDDLQAEQEEVGSGGDLIKENQKALDRQFFDVKSIAFNNQVRQMVRAKKADWVHNLVYLDGKKFDFAGRDYLFPIYNGRFPRTLLKFSRQCEKSTFLANDTIVESAVIPYNKSVYVSPSYLQTRQFSAGKLTPWMEDSPTIRKFLLSSQVSSQVFEKGMTNGSLIFLRSAFLNADRVRGLSANNLCVSGSSVVHKESGEAVTIEQLVREGAAVGSRILTLNETNFDTEFDEIVRVTASKPKQPLLKIHSQSGRHIVCTPDHPIMTWNGWKRADRLSLEDYVLEASHIPLPSQASALFDTDTGAKASRERVRSVATSTQDPELLKKSNQDVIFQKVTLIEESPDELVYDFTMSKNHNFFANGILVHNCIDELQNMISANIPVIMEVLSHAANPRALFAGTPLTNDNILEQMWQESSQCEWLVRCHNHSPVHYNFLDEKCIGKVGPVCNKCGSPINPADGQWIAFSKERDTMGFHLNQIMVPWMQSPQKWKELVWKYETYSKGQFYNEVLGISFDSASKPVTRTDLVACCDPRFPMRLTPDHWTQSLDLFMGVDWGTGSDGSERDEKGRLRTASYTVVTIGAYINPKQFHPFFFKKYIGDHAIPSNCIRDIIQLARLFNVKMIGADWGFGWAANDQLESAFGLQRVIKWQYVGMQRERMKYDQVAHKFSISRTEVMSDFFADIKKGVYVFPPWEHSQEYLKDIEHIFAEASSTGQLRYDHKKTEPDDTAHAIIFAREAADRYYGRTR